ncbi:energy transducer TonB [Aliiglaciecola lipolytica]|uniref:Protein TonB n=1 Tax=Aliiglaciecola lipolytica E3 TaxID=1127673 RepID=K6X5D3_9ALTE|nr:energy transducer TonB [Aliiglaciecola lipolytica]GAC15809.1 periplasmic protein TonB [Aliiglaciecola lipolytica E3]
MARLLLAVVLAFFITVSLFFLMQALIASGDQTLEDPKPGAVLDFVRLKQEETVQQKDRKPRKPPPPKEPPPQMDQPQMDSPTPDADGGGIAFEADVGGDVALGSGLALESGDGEYLPIVKVAPVYPRRALSRGIEGFVIVEFTVSKLGAVKDIRVVEATPPDIFNQAAMEAALKFKYKPRVVNGEPAEVSGVQNRITFQIDG